MPCLRCGFVWREYNFPRTNGGRRMTILILLMATVGNLALGFLTATYFGLGPAWSSVALSRAANFLPGKKSPGAGHAVTAHPPASEPAKQPAHGH